MRLLVPAGLLLLAACGGPSGPTIDGSSPERFTASLATVRAKLDPATRARFDAAVSVAEAEAFYASPDHASFERNFRARLNGKTAQEVIATVSITGEYNVRRSKAP